MHYHHRNAERNTTVVHVIELLTAVAFIVVVLTTMWHFTHLVVGLASDHKLPAWEETASTVCFVIGVATPTALAALIGFLSQIEAVRLKQRSESMTKLLAERHCVLSSFRTDDPDSVEARWLFPIEAAATGGLMVDETAGWALIYKNTDIHAG